MKNNNNSKQNTIEFDENALKNLHSFEKKMERIKEILQTLNEEQKRTAITSLIDQTNNNSNNPTKKRKLS